MAGQTSSEPGLTSDQPAPGPTAADLDAITTRPNPFEESTVAARKRRRMDNKIPGAFSSISESANFSLAIEETSFSNLSTSSISESNSPENQYTAAENTESCADNSSGNIRLSLIQDERMGLCSNSKSRTATLSLRTSQDLADYDMTPTVPSSPPRSLISSSTRIIEDSYPVLSRSSPQDVIDSTHPVLPDSLAKVIANSIDLDIKNIPVQNLLEITGWVQSWLSWAGQQPESAIQESLVANSSLWNNIFKAAGCNRQDAVMEGAHNLRALIQLASTLSPVLVYLASSYFSQPKSTNDRFDNDRGLNAHASEDNVLDHLAMYGHILNAIGTLQPSEQLEFYHTLVDHLQKLCNMIDSIVSGIESQLETRELSYDQGFNIICSVASMITCILSLRLDHHSTAAQQFNGQTYQELYKRLLEYYKSLRAAFENIWFCDLPSNQHNAAKWLHTLDHLLTVLPSAHDPYRDWDCHFRPGVPSPWLDNHPSTAIKLVIIDSKLFSLRPVLLGNTTVLRKMFVASLNRSLRNLYPHLEASPHTIDPVEADLFAEILLKSGVIQHQMAYGPDSGPWIREAGMIIARSPRYSTELLGQIGGIVPGLEITSSRRTLLAYLQPSIQVSCPELCHELVLRLAKLDLYGLITPMARSVLKTTLYRARSLQSPDTQTLRDSFELSLKIVAECVHKDRSLPYHVQSIVHELHQIAMHSLHCSLKNLDKLGQSWVLCGCIDLIKTQSPFITASYIALQEILPSILEHTSSLSSSILSSLVDTVIDDFRYPTSSRLGGVLTEGSVHPRNSVVMSIMRSDYLSEAQRQNLWSMMVGTRCPSPDDRIQNWKLILRLLQDQSGCIAVVKDQIFTEVKNMSPQLYDKGLVQFLGEYLKLSFGQREPAKYLFPDHPEAHSIGTPLSLLWKIVSERPGIVADEASRVLVETYCPHLASTPLVPLLRKGYHKAFLSVCCHLIKDAHMKLCGYGREYPITSLNNPIEYQLKQYLKLLDSFLIIRSQSQDLPSVDTRSLLSEDVKSAYGDSFVVLDARVFHDDWTDAKVQLRVNPQQTVCDLINAIYKVTGLQDFVLFRDSSLFRLFPESSAMILEDSGLLNFYVTIRPVPQVASFDSESFIKTEILAELHSSLMADPEISKVAYRVLSSLGTTANMINSFMEWLPPYRMFNGQHQYLAEYAVLLFTRLLGADHDMPDAPRIPDTARNVTLQAAIKYLSTALADNRVMGNCEFPFPWPARSIMSLLPDMVHALASLPSASKIEAITSPCTVTLASLMESLSCQNLTVMTANFPILLKTAARVGSHNHDGWIQMSNRLTPLLNFVFTHPNTSVSNLTLDAIKDIVFEEEILLPRSPKFSGYLWSLLLVVFSKFPNSFSYNSSILGSVCNLMRLPELRRAITPFLAERLKNSVRDHPASIGKFDPMIYWLSDNIRASWTSDLETGNVDIDQNLCYMITKEILFKHNSHSTGVTLQGMVTESSTRHTLYQILFLAWNYNSQFHDIILDGIDSALSCYSILKRDVANILNYPMDWYCNGIRSPCGYVGLENLHSTCYINSLVSQLYMNPEFRQLVLSSSVLDGEKQKVVQELRWLFITLQNSYKRSIRPDSFILSIPTFDGTTIDPSIQMDAEEFLGLLMERLESQLLVPDQKSQLKTFFQGQLVQQIKGVECGHVSERLEAFNSIVCNVKHLATLQNSLEAYISGEMMDGDNKYHCSACEEKVDAVKRACLKKVPDNLIFHLKRFEFNLQTYQRNKVDDHFEFPEEIDISPYTADYLANAEGSQERLSASPDIFKLVGILVHSGTVDSGHYYSMIRDRTSLEDSKWVWFNDDDVREWDPQNMETDTFGGSKCVQDEQGNYQAIPPPSAYMLFYQRASTLVSSPVPIQSAVSDSPADVEIKSHLDIMNKLAVYDHCLSAREHQEFCTAIFRKILPHNSPGDVHSNKHERCIELLCNQLSTIITHSNSRYLSQLVGIALAASEACEHCSDCLFGVLTEDNDNFNQLVLLSEDAHPVITDLFVGLLNILKRQFEQRYRDFSDTSSTLCYLSKLMGLVNQFWCHIGSIQAISYLNCIFGLLARIAEMGDFEVSILLSHNCLVRALEILLVDERLRPNPDNSDLHQSILAHLSDPQITSIPMIQVARLARILVESLDRDVPVPKFENPTARRNAWSSEGHIVQSPFPWTSLELGLVHVVFPQSFANLRGCNVLAASICRHQLMVSPKGLAEGGKLIRLLYGLDDRLSRSIGKTASVGLKDLLYPGRTRQFTELAILIIDASGDNDVSIAKQLAVSVSRGAVQYSTPNIRIPVVFFTKLARYGTFHADSPGSSGFSMLHIVLLSLSQWSHWALFGHADMEIADRVQHFIKELMNPEQYSLKLSPEVVTGLSGIIAEVAEKLLARCIQHVERYIIKPAMTISRSEIEPIMAVIDNMTQILAEINPDFAETYAATVNALWDSLSHLFIDEGLDNDDNDSNWNQLDEIYTSVLDEEGMDTSVD